MDSFKIEVEETKTYWQRMKRACMWPLIFVISFLLESPCFDIYEHRPLEIPAVIIVFDSVILIILVLYCDGMCKYYISLFEIKEGRVHMIYTKRNERIELNNSIDKFKFKVTLGFFQNIRLRITYKNYFVISQYYKWNWEKSGAFGKINDFLRKNKLQTTGFWN